MNPETLVIEKTGTVDWVTLNRPSSKNAITPQMANKLADYFSGLKSDLGVRIVVLRGAGGAFCAGLDIKAFASAGQAREPGIERLPDIVRDMRQCPQPIISVIDGAACGGGFALALASDIRVATLSARMNVAFINLGLSGCELGMSYFLPRFVGLSVATELMYTGRFLTAAQAHRYGLISEVTNEEDAEMCIRRLVGDMLRAPPLALRKTKETINRSIGIPDLEAVLALEQFTQWTCMSGPDFKEGLEAFIEKREPSFSKV